MEKQMIRASTGLRKIFLVSKQQLTGNSIQRIKNRTSTNFNSNDKRLPQTSKFRQRFLFAIGSKRIQKPKIINQKFKKFVGTTQVNWGKWNLHQKQRSTQRFIDIGKRKSQQKERQKLIIKQDTQILKLRHKIREILKLRQNIDKGHRNNQLISQLSQQSQQKVNKFFQKFEDQINRIA